MILRLAVIGAALLAGSAVAARGASPYLPLGLSPEIEHQIERGLALAGVPVMTRPIPAATVLDSMPAICDQDATLCADIGRYLSGLTKRFGLSHASIAVAATSTQAGPLPNRHGMPSDSSYEISASAYFLVGDYLVASGGLAAYQDSTVPTNTVVSLGTERVQVDLGYRDHWLSPMTDSAMLLSTEAETAPSITVSNYAPLTRWRLRYQAFVAELSDSDLIRYRGSFTSGKPRLAGLSLSIEPMPGWSIGVNRILQYGGGERPSGFGDLLDAFFRPSQYDNSTTGDDFGNQAASITSRFLLPGPRPVAVYFEYAGEDTSKNSDVRLGNTSLSAGLFLPAIGDTLDLTIEISEWQNGWYVNHIYQDGLRNEGDVIGHWGADLREPGDGVGARSFMARVGWRPHRGGIVEATYRALANESYTAPDYQRADSLELRYSRKRGELYLGGELFVGHDASGESYSRISAFMRF